MRIALLLIVLLFQISLNAQWVGPDLAKRIYYSAGNVGIGLDLPTSKLHIKTADQSAMLLCENPYAQFFFHSNNIELKGKPNYQTPVLSWFNPAGLRQASLGGRNDSFGLALENGMNLYIGGGNVGIGVTDTKGYQLAVAGKIVSEEVVVKLRQYWPDYVFSSEYKLPDLRMLEEFIIDNHHLPGIPDAKQIQEAGIPLGDISTLLLKKIEELTLYIIQQSKDAEALSCRIESLEAELNK